MNLTHKHCIPCEAGMPTLTNEEEDIYMKELSSWILLRESAQNNVHRLIKQFKFKNFKQAIEFINKVANIAEAEGHHPDIYIFYNKVQLDLLTHAVGGLSENDFILASKIDQIT